MSLGILEAVLSETILDEMASDLGIEADVLRKHPFFRVLKGRILLTYPLKTAAGMPEFQAVANYEKADPTQATWYEALSDTGKGGVLYQVKARTDDAVTVITRYVRITLDGVAVSLASVDEAGAEFWFVRSIEDISKTKPTSILNLGYSESMKVEVYTDTTLVGGKKIVCGVHWGKVI